jgi:hypothetical protein
MDNISSIIADAEDSPNLIPENCDASMQGCGRRAIEAVHAGPSLFHETTWKELV